MWINIYYLQFEFFTFESIPVLLLHPFFIAVSNKWIRFNEQLFVRPCGKTPSAFEMDIENMQQLK